MADTSSDFLRVRSLWHTRVGRSKSKETQEKPRAPLMVSPEKEVGDCRPSVLEFTIESQTTQTPALEGVDQYPIKNFVQEDIAQADVVHVFTPIKRSDDAPPSPIFSAPSSYLFEEVDDVSKPAKQDDDGAPVSPASATSTSPSMPSPSMSPSKPAMNPVTSMFRTFSDARLFASSSDSSPKENASSSLFSASLPVPSIPSMPDMSAWKMKFNYGSIIKDSPPPLSSSSSSSTLLSIPTPWRCTRSASDSACSQSSSTSAFSFPSVNLMSALPPREAAENAITNVHHMCSRYRSGTNCTNIARGSPYGELIVADILAARDLLVDQDESGVDLPFRATMQLGCMSRQTSPANRATLSVHERFVFWLPSSPTIDQRTLDLFVHGSDERDLGEVHLSLAMPVNEAFENWYPLVCRADGHKHGTVRVAMRRLVLTTSPMFEAGKALSTRECCLSYADHKLYGELLPELWSSFPIAESASPLGPTEERVKLTDFSQRLFNFDHSTEPPIQRDVF